jgi:hypothetical protein
MVRSVDPDIILLIVVFIAHPVLKTAPLQGGNQMITAIGATQVPLAQHGRVITGGIEGIG